MKKPEHRAASSDAPTPPRLRLKLATADDVRRELAKLYREARTDRVPVADASRLANVLQILARCIETSDLEARITELEGKHGNA
jgi:hypothetical protein